MLAETQNEEKQNISRNSQKNIETKICDKIDFLNFLDEIQADKYERSKKPKSCNTAKSLLIFSIIIVIFTCAGFYFSISRNEGYKQYKELLENNITLFKDDFPSEYISKKRVAYLNMDEFDDYDNISCAYIEYSLSKCELVNYTKYCTDKRYSENRCNFMDREYFQGRTFVCNYNNYNNKLCNEIQYLDELHKNDDVNEKNKLKNENLTEYYFENIWCKIGNYDIPILLSYFIVMILFIVSLIFDLCINKATLIIGIKYYIALSSYMLFYFIFKIYIILFLFLLAYSMAVSCSSPSTSKFSDPFFSKENEDDMDPAVKLWKDKRIYAFIYCGINLLLLIFNINLGFNDSLLNKYLSVNFGENDNSEISRKASIKIGKNNYDIEIKQNKNIYLKDRRENEKYYFKEIIYDNNTYYLKFNNKGLKDQLGWIEYNYPLVNDGFDYLVFYFKIFIFIYMFSMLILPIFHFKDDIFYKYVIHLIDLGAKPYLYGCFKGIGDLQILLYNLIEYIYLVEGVIILLAIYRWAIYGGFSNIVHIWIALFISIIIYLINLGFLVLSFLTIVYNIISLFLLQFILPSESDLIFGKLYVLCFLYFFILIFIIILIIINFTFSNFLNSVRKETKKFENEEIGPEEVFKVKTYDNENFIFEAVNSENVPKNLFYSKKNDENPISNSNQSDYLFLEQRQEQLLDKRKQMDLKTFKTNYKNGLTEFILENLNKILFLLAFIIASISISIKKNIYYKMFREYLIGTSELISYTNLYSDNNMHIDGLSSFTKLWCEFGNIESKVTISYLIFIIICICFQIIQYFIYIGVIKLDFKKGISYNAIIFINSLFYVGYMIYYPLLFFLFIYSIIILAISPFDADSGILSKAGISKTHNQYNELWENKKIIPGINAALKFFIFAFNASLSGYIKTLIIHYLNLNYEDEREEKDKKYEKNTSVVINNNTYNITIISNDILYLKQIDSGEIYKFKQISIETITDGCVYVKLGLNSITDQISISEWHYPEFNLVFSKIATICKLVYAILFISIPLFKCLIKEEFNYILYISSNKIIKEIEYKTPSPQFNDIFVFIGDFEDGVIKSRFSLYVISIFFLLISLMKRIYNGGSNTEKSLKISHVASVIFVVLNIIYFIINFLITLFEILSLICAFDLNFNDNILIAKLFIQIILNGIIFFISIKLLVDSIKISKNLNDLKMQLIKFNKVEDLEDTPKIDEFKYMALEGNVCKLKEVRNENLQRYLYYFLDINENENDNNNDINDNIIVYNNNKDSEVLNIKNNVDIQVEDIIEKENLAPETNDRMKQ